MTDTEFKRKEISLLHAKKAILSRRPVNVESLKNVNYKLEALEVTAQLEQAQQELEYYEKRLLESSQFYKAALKDYDNKAHQLTLKTLFVIDDLKVKAPENVLAAVNAYESREFSSEEQFSYLKLLSEFIEPYETHIKTK